MRTNRNLASRALSPLLLAIVCAMLITASLSRSANANVNGAVYTTNVDASKVNQNLYPSKTDVYLSGGPRPPACNAGGLSPDGDYYFQVTDPSGATLLSSDPLQCRVVTVKNGVVTAYNPQQGGCTGHLTGVPFATCGETPPKITVQLAPFDDTPNNGGVYKMWVMPVSAGLPAGCVDTAAEGDTGWAECANFDHSNSKTDNFRVKKQGPPNPPPTPQFDLDVFKFCDANANGVLDPDELTAGLAGWEITVKQGGNAVCDNFTNINGIVECLGLTPGSYDIFETLKAGFKHTATCSLGFCGACATHTTDLCNTDSDCVAGGGGACTLTDGTSPFSITGNTDPVEVSLGNVGLNTFSGSKFADNNANGVNNSEPGVGGVKILLTGTDANGGAVSQCAVTASDGSYSFGSLLPGMYSVSEVPPAGTIQTAPTPPSCFHTFTPDPVTCAGSTSTCTFGNVCLNGKGGFTLGFWHNKNGQALITAADITFLKGLNLRNANGSNFDPANKAALASWLIGANATNMANMLSAQLAAMELNTRHGLSSGSLLLAGTAPNGCNIVGLSGTGFISIADAMNDANSAPAFGLGADGSTPAGDPHRACQEFLKNALDAGNNDLNIVGVCPATFAATCP